MRASPSRPRLSVVIPTYRRDDALARCVSRLLQQTEPAVEIVVVDQNAAGFVDDALGADLDRVVHVRLEEPNCSTARNVGALAAKADSLLFIDDDLIPPATFCADGLDLLQRAKGLGCFVPLVRGVGTSDHTARAAYAHRRQSVHPADPSVWQIDETFSACVFFERWAFERSGGFDEGLFQFARAGEDHELFRRMGAGG